MLKTIAGVALAVTGTAAITATTALTQGANPGAAGLVGLRNVGQATAVQQRFGNRALFAWDKKANRFVSVSVHAPHKMVTLFASIDDAKVALGAYKTANLVRWRSRHRDSTTSPVTTTPTAVTTTTTAPASSPAPTAPPAPSTAPTPALTLGSGSVLFDDTFGSLNGSNWNTFVTSNAAGGSPWNSNGSGGSGEGNPSANFDADYNLPSQVSVNPDGLALTAQETPTAGMLGQTPSTFAWRSGVVSSYNHFQFDGGTLEISAKMPSGGGMWPGLWMLPGPGGTQGDNAEIDLFEGGYSMSGVNPNDVFAWHLHSSSGVVGGNVNTGVDLSAGYHTYGLKWVPGQSITWYLDGTQLAQTTSAQATIPNEPMELIMNVQVANSAASSWHPTYDGSTPTSTAMSVREVKVTSS